MEGWTGFFTIYLYASNGDPQHVIFALSSALAVLIPIDILRLRYPSLEYAFEKCVGIFMRDSEKVRVCAPTWSPDTDHRWSLQKSSNGVIWYMLGVDAVLVALPLDIAVVSVLMYVVFHSLSMLHPVANAPYPQQPFLGRHSRIYLWPALRQPNTPPPQAPLRHLPTRTAKEFGRIRRCHSHGCGYCYGILDVARADEIARVDVDMAIWGFTEFYWGCSYRTRVPADVCGMDRFAHRWCLRWTRDRHRRGSWCVFYAVCMMC